MMDNVDSVLWRLGRYLKGGGGGEGKIGTATLMKMVWEMVKD